MRFPFAVPANCDAGSQTGEIIERRLEHENGEARKFYAGLATPARIGMEATGYAQWFERMLAEQGHQLWVGDAAEIRAAMVRKQKTDSVMLPYSGPAAQRQISADLDSVHGGAGRATTAAAPI